MSGGGAEQFYQAEIESFLQLPDAKQSLQDLHARKARDTVLLAFINPRSPGDISVNLGVCKWATRHKQIATFLAKHFATNDDTTILIRRAVDLIDKEDNHQILIFLLIPSGLYVDRVRDVRALLA